MSSDAGKANNATVTIITQTEIICVLIFATPPREASDNFADLPYFDADAVKMDA